MAFFKSAARPNAEEKRPPRHFRAIVFSLPSPLLPPKLEQLTRSGTSVCSGAAPGPLADNQLLPSHQQFILQKICILQTHQGHGGLTVLEWKGRVPSLLCLSLSLLGGLTMPEWKGRVPLTRSHCERIT
ncbi:hypothetical protein EVAR_44508_1 [Eumeta japonica]|uniref:Uncharacterized protein n=1 Tax=Eumeta variegata TaxID=151549 RepID=A0A4C1YHH0_EUMVA|nr:hypothetical protein EVAR_44508_1 [Eumeta japonica]